ncbi:TPA: hypothetical protein I7E55_001949 [Vibrio cholerae]|nr:hypothetical protein [Vibrio cholerae]
MNNEPSKILDQFPEISFADFNHPEINYILTFNINHKVFCYGYPVSDESYNKLKEKCENYYLKRPHITAYKIYVRPPHMRVN